MKKNRSIFSVIPRAIVFSIILGALFYFVAPKLGYKTYRAQAKILTTEANNIKSDDKTAYTYAETVNSDAVKHRVIENLKLDMSPVDLDKKMEIKTVGNSHILNINVVDSVKLRSEDIADEYADITVGVINELYDAKAKVLDYAYNNASPLNVSSKLTTRVIVAGFLTYLIFSSFLLSIRNLKLEDEVKEEKPSRKVVFTEEDVKDDYETEEVSIDDEDEKKDEEINLERDIDTRQTFENNGKEYKIISDIPKYDDGDIDV